MLKILSKRVKNFTSEKKLWENMGRKASKPHSFPNKFSISEKKSWKYYK